MQTKLKAAMETKRNEGGRSEGDSNDISPEQFNNLKLWFLDAKISLVLNPLNFQ